jgi:hypothetical protein
MRVDQYTTKKFSFVCLNLEPQHYEFLKEIANTRFDGSSYCAIFYLLNKYLHHLYEIRITPIKTNRNCNLSAQNQTIQEKNHQDESRFMEQVVRNQAFCRVFN